jgi:thiol-disulfide isomerase/thioredoxin
MNRTKLVALAVLAGLAAGVAAVYGIGGGGGNRESASCPGAAAVAARIAPLAKGEVAAVNVQSTPKPLPALAFLRPDGSKATLADYKGRTVLLNLWATWCAPCRHEMPALDALQQALGGADFEVVAVNIDTRNVEKAATFLDEVGVKTLVRYADPTAGIFQDLKKAGKAVGMPTTILIDKDGCELANIAGPAEWAGADAKAMITAALGR